MDDTNYQSLTKPVRNDGLPTGSHVPYPYSTWERQPRRSHMTEIDPRYLIRSRIPLVVKEEKVESTTGLRGIPQTRLPAIWQILADQASTPDLIIADF